ncbi:MAG TPA: DUF2500 family protein [Pirellulaceae bacterium]|nr:DUF2500 family protein [Planctomycetales bacterium]HRX80210.1 DUF2500 family protein [Pirellulaceae bacterium]
MKCLNCGADIASDAPSCTYCGSATPASDVRNCAAIFAKIRDSTAFKNRDTHERRERLPKLGAFHKAFMLGFFAIFIGGAAFMCVAALGMAGVTGIFGSRFAGGRGAAFSIAPLIFALFPLGFVVFGVFMLRAAKAKMNKFENDPTTAILIIVVDKRTHVWGGGGDSSANTHYFVTCETEDGSREEYQVWDGAMYGKMSAGDAGILFVRSKYGLDFDRVAV